MVANNKDDYRTRSMDCMVKEEQWHDSGLMYCACQLHFVATFTHFECISLELPTYTVFVNKLQTKI